MEEFMPANLPPEYFKADERFRAAGTIAEKIACLEELYATIPKHKGTDKLRADVRRRLAKLKAESQTKKHAARHESAFHIEREGAGQVAVVGPPNTGKSSLLVKFTRARPEVADFPLTTWVPTPGMMHIENIQVQLVDTPPLQREHVEPGLFDLIRGADVLLIILDVTASPLQQFEETVSILREHRILPLPIADQAADPSRTVVLPTLVLANKNDDSKTDEDAAILRECIGDKWTLMPVSIATERNLDRMKQWVFEVLGIVRVYSKPQGKKPDLASPFVLKKGSTVADLAGKVHKDFLDRLSTARLWGNGVHDGQLVGRDHILKDGDVVELKIS
jgi:ribosome-interacting GTPase 1